MIKAVYTCVPSALTNHIFQSNLPSLITKEDTASKVICGERPIEFMELATWITSNAKIKWDDIVIFKLFCCRYHMLKSMCQVSDTTFINSFIYADIFHYTNYKLWQFIDDTQSCTKWQISESLSRDPKGLWEVCGLTQEIWGLLQQNVIVCVKISESGKWYDCCTTKDFVILVPNVTRALTERKIVCSLVYQSNELS